jgi:multicomponent Na+:H+ antiporter subunit F
MDPLRYALPVALGMLLLGLLLSLVRVWRGPRTADRVIALDTAAHLTIGVCGLHALDAQEALSLRPAIPLALLAFLGTVAFARYLEKRGLER